MWQEPSYLLAGLPFSLTLLTILLAHEFGHFLTDRDQRQTRLPPGHRLHNRPAARQRGHAHDLRAAHAGRPAAYHIYVRYNALINGTGGGGSQNGGGGLGHHRPGHDRAGVLQHQHRQQLPRPATTRSRSTARWRPTSRFLAASSGFVGQPSDGLTQLDTSHALTATLPERGQRQRRADRRDQHRPRRPVHARARLRARPRPQSIRTAEASAATPFGCHLRRATGPAGCVTTPASGGRRAASPGPARPATAS